MSHADSPIYAQLFDQFQRQRTIALEHCRFLSARAHTFRQRIHDRLGYPNAAFAAKDGQSYPWVRIYERDEAREVVVPIGDRFMVETVALDGGISFAVAAALSSTLGSFPKRYFWAGYSAWIEGDVCVLQPSWASGTIYRIQVDEDLAPAVEAFIGVLSDALRRDPMARQGAGRPGIGFTADV